MKSTYQLFEREWNNPSNKMGFIKDIKNAASKTIATKGNLKGFKKTAEAIKKVHKFVDQG